jgi:hypothetical protein
MPLLRRIEPYESGADHFFRQSSRTLLESQLQVATPREPQSIPKLLELSRDQLKQALSGTPAYSLIDPGSCFSTILFDGAICLNQLSHKCRDTVSSAGYMFASAMDLIVASEDAMFLPSLTHYF